MNFRNGLVAATILALPVAANAQPLTGLYLGGGAGVNIMQNAPNSGPAASVTKASTKVAAARHAAGHMLAAYNAEAEEELRLAAEIVSFSFHALEALSEAAAPDLSFNRKLRLRGSAVSLSRESHKSQRNST